MDQLKGLFEESIPIFEVDKKESAVCCYPIEN